MGYLKHKGYVGSVEYSEEDECLYGKVQGIANACITYEGHDIAELKRDFMEAVDDYLAACEARGEKAMKSYSGSLNVRINPETHSSIAILAKQAGISINAFIRDALEKRVAVML